VKFGPLTTEITQLMFTHPRSTVCVLRMLNCIWEQATWLCYRANFIPCIFHQSDLGRWADSRWALPQISGHFLYPVLKVGKSKAVPESWATWP